MTVEWYGVRCHFDHGPSELVPDAHVYEERIVILRATSFADAVKRAELDAEKYASVLPGVEYLGFAQAYLIADDIADDPRQEFAEVYSLMRSSTLPANEYIDRFFATGSEHEGAGDEPA
jgi:hypothetical protein